MKSKIVSIFVLVFVFSISLFSQQSRMKIYSNVSEIDGNIKKEFTVFDNTSSNALIKKTYLYNEEGKRIEEILSMWDVKKGWSDIKIYTYVYNDNKLASIAYKGRKTPQDAWPKWSENIIYTYDNNGSLLSVKKVKSKDIINLLSQK